LGGNSNNFSYLPNTAYGFTPSSINSTPYSNFNQPMISSHSNSKISSHDYNKYVNVNKTSEIITSDDNTNFLRPEVGARSSIFNQIHRLNSKNPKELVKESSISIENNSNLPLLIRLSGNYNHAGKDIFNELEPGKRRIFDRAANSIYKLHFTTSETLKGSVYNIKSGCIYKINQSFNLIDPAENTIISTFSQYIPIFEWKGAFSAIYEKENTSFTNFINENNIIIVNKANDSLAVKLLADTANNFEDFIEIEPLVYVTYKRKPGKYIASISKKGDESNDRYELQTGDCYVWDTYSGLVNFSKYSKKVEKYLEFDSQLRYNTITNQNLNKNDSFAVSKNWLLIKNFLKNNNNKKRIKDFNHLLFRFIDIQNNSNIEIHVRIKSRKIGSEDFMQIKPGNSIKWKRFDGEFLTEVILPNLKSIRFNLKSDYEYSFTKEKKLNNKLTNSPIPNVKELFGSDDFIVFDPQNNSYLRKKIDYSDEFVSNNISDYLKKEEEVQYEYYNNKKPNYISGQQFIDQDFPPNKTTLAAVDPYTGQRRKPHFLHLPDSLSQQQINSYVFKRPKDLFNGKYYLYKDDICYEDVKQGTLGDCFLMSVIASLSKRPDLIKAIFKTTTINPDGFYEIFYWENGKKKVMFVDDNFVTGSQVNEEYPFAQPNGEELWVMLIEKAYAKYEGGFSNIIGGVMATELTWLTGAMARHMMTKDPNCWREIVNAVKAGYIITSGSQAGSGNHFNQSARGISNGHAYSILDAKEYRDSQKNIRLLRLRNPWGNTEWQGDYSDGCSKWTPELRRFFNNNEDKDDGVFFMTFDDYKSEFANVVICCIEARN